MTHGSGWIPSPGLVGTTIRPPFGVSGSPYQLDVRAGLLARRTNGRQLDFVKLQVTETRVERPPNMSPNERIFLRA
jgi:hypothetical protein